MSKWAGPPADRGTQPFPREQSERGPILETACPRGKVMANRLVVPATVALLGSLMAVPAYPQDAARSWQVPAISLDIPAPPADGQDAAARQPATAPPNLAYIEGAVEVVQDGVTERADPPLILLEGDIVRTRNGRAEIVFGDGTLLHLSENSELEMLGEERLRLVGGRALLRVSYSAARAYVIDTPASAVRLEAQGEYSVMTDRSARLEVAVTRGSATVDDPQWTIRGAQMLSLSAPGARPLIQSFNSARWDAFEQWSYDRANGFAASPSSTQLPYELRPYAPMFDTYGRWDYVAPHGYVWYPSVGADWRPYYDGWWGVTRFGWTWHGRDRWAWPTHHYGRWGFRGNFWYWIPAKVWAPAWVTWSVASGFVSWAPLGWDNRPAIGWWTRPDHPAYWPDYGPGRAWTIVPRDHFAPRRNVRAHAIGFDRLDDNARRELAQAVVAAPIDRAVPRDSLTIPGLRGNVRRPQRAVPSNDVTVPGAPQIPPRIVEPNLPAARSRRPEDHPAYAPRDGYGRPISPSTRTLNSGDDRGGRVREPRDPASAPRDPYDGVGGRSAPRDPNGATGRPRTRSAPSDDSGDRGRAVPRGRPQGGPPPAGAAGAPPSSQGGAVERGSRPAPRAGAPAGRSGSPPPSGPPPSRGSARRPGV